LIQTRERTAAVLKHPSINNVPENYQRNTDLCKTAHRRESSKREIMPQLGDNVAMVEERPWLTAAKATLGEGILSIKYL
jgi:hypothetical protein